jgi:tetratricopeptide (TPR) repeat protein
MKNDIRGAIRDLNQVIIIRPQFANAYLLRGLARFELNDYASALRDFDQCIRFDAHNAYAFANRGIVKQKLEDYKGAIMDYDMALYLDPTMANTYMNRGIAKEILKYAGFEQDYAMAAKLDPKFAFDPRNVDSSALAQAKQKQNQSQNQVNHRDRFRDKLRDRRRDKLRDSTGSGSGTTARYKSGAQTGNEEDVTAVGSDWHWPIRATCLNRRNKKEVTDGRIQNKNVNIDFAAHIQALVRKPPSNEYFGMQYYNFALEAINNFNNYEPTITITNRPGNHSEDSDKIHSVFQRKAEEKQSRKVIIN